MDLKLGADVRDAIGRTATRSAELTAKSKSTTLLLGMHWRATTHHQTRRVYGIYLYI